MSATTSAELEMEPADIVVPPQGGYTAKTPACRVHNDHDVTLTEDMKDPVSAADQQRMDEGNVFEDEIGDAFRLCLDPDTAVFLPADRLDDDGNRLEEDKRAREIATIAAMADGAEFIWNCRFPADEATSRISEADALVRIGRKPKANGKWAYAPIDVKHHNSLEGTAGPYAQKVSELADPRFEAAVSQMIGDGTPQLKDSMQLCHYHRHLETLGFAQETDEVWGAIVGKSRQLVWRDLTAPSHQHHDRESGKRRRMSPMEVYDQEFAFRLEVIARAIARNDDPDLEPLARPTWKTECKSCHWRTVCHDELTEIDHVTLVPGVTATNTATFLDSGITTRATLARLHYATAVVVDAGIAGLADLIADAKAAPDPTRHAAELVSGSRSVVSQSRALAAAGLDTIGDVAKLHEPTARLAGRGFKNLAASIDQARVVKAEKVFLRRGLAKLDIPRGDVELDVDMENEPGGLIYLWGTKLTVRKPGLQIPGGSYRPFFTFESFEDHEGEARAFAEMWEYIRALQTICKLNGLTFRAYCYTRAEDRCMRHVVDKNVGMRGMPTREELEEFLASDAWVDLHKDVVENQLLWPTENLSLKTVAKWARFSWRESEASGDNSVVWYRQAVSHPDPEVRAEQQQRILEYNEDDVAATEHVREWLWTLANGRGAAKVANVSTLERRFQPRRATARSAA